MSELKNKIKICEKKIEKLRSEGESFFDDIQRKYHTYTKNEYEKEFNEEE
jgi:hypothetical protein